MVSPPLELSPAQSSRASLPVSAPIRTSPKPTQPDGKNEENRASPKMTAKPAKSATKAQKLEIRESKKNGQESWTVKTGRKASFRVRLADAGFRVNFRFHDEAGNDRELYCCYLSATEWKQAKRQTLANFAAKIVAKLNARKASESADAAKLDALIERIQSLTT